MIRLCIFIENTCIIISEVQDAAMHCLTQLIKSASNKKHADKSSDDSLIEFFSNLRCESVLSARCGAGDACDARDAGDASDARDARNAFDASVMTRDNCQPDYLCEEICKLLLIKFQDLFDKRKCDASQGTTSVNKPQSIFYIYMNHYNKVIDIYDFL